MRKSILFMFLILPAAALGQISIDNGVCSMPVPGGTAEWICAFIPGQPGSERLLTFNANALPDVSFSDSGEYLAVLQENVDNKTLHFNQNQGRLDSYAVRFPFVATAYNVGIGSVSNPDLMPRRNGNTYIFAGIQVHERDFNSLNSAHFVVGHRGSTSATVEVKSTIDGRSWVADGGSNVAPTGRMDIRIEGIKGPGGPTENWIRISMKEPGSADWAPITPTGQLPTRMVAWGDEVLVGLITYAQNTNGVPFVGAADSFSVVQQ